jgi:hypothetical protein
MPRFGRGPSFRVGAKQYAHCPTLPSQFGNSEGDVADTSVGRGNGSRLYELNLWMWLYRRGQPRHVTAAEAEQRRKKLDDGQRRR